MAPRLKFLERGYAASFDPVFQFGWVEQEASAKAAKGNLPAGDKTVKALAAGC